MRTPASSSGIMKTNTMTKVNSQLFPDRIPEEHDSKTISEVARSLSSGARENFIYT